MNRAEDDDMRALARDAAMTLPAGAHHYTACIGPPERRDVMNAMLGRP